MTPLQGGALKALREHLHELDTPEVVSSWLEVKGLSVTALADLTAKQLLAMPLSGLAAKMPDAEQAKMLFMALHPTALGTHCILPDSSP
eukprot:gene9411-8431_t